MLLLLSLACSTTQPEPAAVPPVAEAAPVAAPVPAAPASNVNLGEAFDETTIVPVDTLVKVYLNRLSDWLFVASRWIAKKAGEPEALWTP